MEFFAVAVALFCKVNNVQICEWYDGLLAEFHWFVAMFIDFPCSQS